MMVGHCVGRTDMMRRCAEMMAAGTGRDAPACGAMADGDGHSPVACTGPARLFVQQVRDEARPVLRAAHDSLNDADRERDRDDAVP